MLAAQYPDSVIEGDTSGHLDDGGGSVTFSVRIREAREADREQRRGVGGEPETEDDRDRVQREHAERMEALSRKDEEVARATREAQEEQKAQTEETTNDPTRTPAGTPQAGDAPVVPSGAATAQRQPQGADGRQAVGNIGGTDQAGSSTRSGTPPRNA